jgi:hypothetical protein
MVAVARASCVKLSNNSSTGAPSSASTIFRILSGHTGGHASNTLGIQGLANISFLLSFSTFEE